MSTRCRFASLGPSSAELWRRAARAASAWETALSARTATAALMSCSRAQPAMAPSANCCAGQGHGGSAAFFPATRMARLGPSPRIAARRGATIESTDEAVGGEGEAGQVPATVCGESPPEPTKALRSEPKIKGGGVSARSALWSPSTRGVLGPHASSMHAALMPVVVRPRPSWQLNTTRPCCRSGARPPSRLPKSASASAS
mmetsp:Transcript_6402/g.14746  ORF Transcript_6402/g.14746 Transcript_6402/m.14746 type:complete len:201 (+) Transcript_6402:435-1037(+)